MKLICKKTGDLCRLCMAGVLPNVIDCPNLLRIETEQDQAEADEPPAE